MSRRMGTEVEEGCLGRGKKQCSMADPSTLEAKAAGWRELSRSTQQDPCLIKQAK